MQPVDVLAGGDQESCGVLDADAEQREGARRDGGDEWCEVLVDARDLGVELRDPPSEGTQREAGRLE